MFRIRRSIESPRVEIVPLIDVIFLVLTFFIYAMVLMIPAKVLPMRLTELRSGSPGRPAPAVTISIDRQGGIYVDREPVSLDRLSAEVQSRVSERPGAIVYIAAEDAGRVDRLPLFIAVWERLSREGLDIRLVGRPVETFTASDADDHEN